MAIDQAIYTSLARQGQAGYHIVSRSAGVSEADVRVLSAWCPSHGALIVDAANRTSVNFHPLGDGRFVLSRTCEGTPEYSGRGGRQLYTHALIFSAEHLQLTGFQPIALYRHALALGLMLYQPEPNPTLPALTLAGVYRTREPEFWTERTRALGYHDHANIPARVSRSQSVRVTFAGNRIDLVECLLNLLPREVAERVSFSTSLEPSPSRPYQISLTGTR
jgi:hypothetical protein